MKKALSDLWIGHLCMLGAEVVWGLMSPIGKDAMKHGVSGFNMVSFRVVGAAICFWIASLFCPKEKVTRKDLFLLIFAGLQSIVFNQCCFIVGLSLTSPINSSIVTTSMPIFTLILGILFMHEKLTLTKSFGMVCGITGALSLILGSASGATGEGNIWGDILCMIAQFSFASYLALYQGLVKRYSTITCMKWMFLFSSIAILPFTASSLSEMGWSEISIKTWGEMAFVVIASTFLSYLLMMRGQKSLTPTQVSVYNYVQPVVATIASTCMGLAMFGWMQAIAILLIFSGVRLVALKR
ncbi:MAG: DMT family transporter [Bacteroidaceae bacterium]|nr:DMT family transporter [Bacteroidaceae bacterium]